MQDFTMPNNAGVGCQLQRIRRSRDPSHGAPYLDRDICSITMWLLEKYQEPHVHLWIDRYYFQSSYLIARLLLDVPDERNEPLTKAALEAFSALGYQIFDSGETTYPYPCCDGSHSKHDALRAYAHIETAIRAQVAPW
ncbi:hypothetical protein [Sulfitobacter sp. AS59]|jgi:hypothetical protein|uniref:hypothetical protein n=1 Tax=Sulfitobacter sp. AS59 TaxID=3135784 RepID=UPI0031735463